ncbi:MAG: glycoside hydrolase family 88 protein [Thermoflexales bacterium]|nr:glycoside hydrolase family 88 protein [Thermoflexales bacterium]
MDRPISSNPLLRQALDFSLERTRQNLAQLSSFPELTQGDHWECVEDGGWVGGHWVGLLWLAFAHAGDAALEAAARQWAARLAPRQDDTTTHDLGFLFELSHVLGVRLTGDLRLKSPALAAAQTLTRRFNSRGRFFQAWDALDAPAEARGRAIIDTLMNLSLLFWASRETGDPGYADMAVAHARMALARHVRPDWSTSHVTDFDPDTGEFLKQDTHQGLSATSCWSRGQAWAVYGYGECFRNTGDATFLDASRRLAEYCLCRLPADHVPYWDYDSPLIPDDVRDSSAAAILASGLLGLSTLDPDAAMAARWRSAAVHILESLWQNYSSQGAREPSILVHGTRSKPHNLMDHGLIYGDYYFVEALNRLMTPDFVSLSTANSMP